MASTSPSMNGPPETRKWLISTHWLFGVACIIGGGFSMAINHLFSKMLTTPSTALDPLHPLWLVTFRQIVVILTTGPQVAYTKAPYLSRQGRDWPYLVIRSVCGGSALTCTQLALARMPLADFATIFATTPVITMIASWPILGERLKITDIPLVLASVLGVLFVVRPPLIFGAAIASDHMDGDFFIGVGLAFGAALFQSGMFLVLRKMKHIPAPTVTFTYALISLLPFLIITGLIGELRLPPCSYTTKAFTILVGAASSVGQLFQTLSSRSLPAGIVSLIRPVEVAFQCLFQIVILHTAVHWLSYLGSGIIVLAMTFLAIRSYFVHKIEKIPSASRSRFETNIYKVFTR